MKVILSRKGFDSATGGYPSPILPDGTLVSLPIPENNTGVYYKDLMVNNNLSYLNLMNQLGIKKYDKSSTAHLDPDINPHSLVRTKNWKPIFGQDNQSASHLNNHRIDVGDLFLFFGWFRKVVMLNGRYSYDPADKFGSHIIWGYLEIGQKISINNLSNYPAAYLSHPHFKNKNRQNNTAYIASNYLTSNTNLKGSGLLKYSENIILSEDNKKRSKWSLPLFMHPIYGTTMTYHENIDRWNVNKNSCSLESVGRGQEFILDGNPCIEKWAKYIIENNS